jgi:hypothetical protein
MSVMVKAEMEEAPFSMVLPQRAAGVAREVPLAHRVPTLDVTVPQAAVVVDSMTWIMRAGMLLGVMEIMAGQVEEILELYMAAAVAAAQGWLVQTAVFQVQVEKVATVSHVRFLVHPFIMQGEVVDRTVEELVAVAQVVQVGAEQVQIHIQGMVLLRPQIREGAAVVVRDIGGEMVVREWSSSATRTTTARTSPIPG